MKNRIKMNSKTLFACIVFMLAFSMSWSQTTFSYTGNLQYYTVPSGVTTIQIEAWGAQGGGGLQNVVGGLGAYASGDFTVTPGQVITILVGGQGIDGTDDGEQAGGSGGGGSFVADAMNSPMLVAGGGGGAMGRAGLPVNGGPGQITTNGQDGALNGGAGGTAGDGGNTWPWTGWHSGTGGGGFLTDCPQPSNGNTSFGTINGPGIAFVNGGAGGFAGSMGRPGGFGGGGAAGFTGGGGGGYSGGGSGTHDSPQTYNGGGGGSYNSGTNQTMTEGVRSGNGEIVITPACLGVDVSTTQNGSMLNANATGVTYQWLNCDNSYAVIAGEVNQFYFPTATGNYAVEITQGSCVDTSVCLNVDFTGIQDVKSSNLELYPNPSSSGIFNLDFDGELEAVQFVDVLGRAVDVSINMETGIIDASQIEAGNYFVIINTSLGVISKEVVISK
jgi:hypothetical protein